MKLHKRLLAGVLAAALLLNNMSTLAYAVDEVVVPPAETAETGPSAEELAAQAAAEEAARQAAEQAAAEEAARQAAEQAAAEEAARQAAEQAAAEEAARQAAEQAAAEEAARQAAEQAAAEQAAKEAEEAAASSNAGEGPSIEGPVTATAPEAAPIPVPTPEPTPTPAPVAEAPAEQPAEQPTPEPEATEAPALDTGIPEELPAVAQLTELTADNGVAVKAILPEGTQLSVSAGSTEAAAEAIAAVLPEGYVPADVQVWDITLTDAAGGKAEMTGDAVVTLPAAPTRDSAVYYIHDGTAQYVTDLAAGQNSFTVSHFSVYAIAAQEPVEPEPTPEPTPAPVAEPAADPDAGIAPAPLNDGIMQIANNEQHRGDVILRLGASKDVDGRPDVWGSREYQIEWWTDEGIVSAVSKDDGVGGATLTGIALGEGKVKHKYSLTPLDNVKYYDYWNVKVYDVVSYTYSAQTGGTVSTAKEDNISVPFSAISDDGIQYNAPKGSAATANTGYKFVGWALASDPDTIISTSPTFIPDITQYKT